MDDEGRDFKKGYNNHKNKQKKWLEYTYLWHYLTYWLKKVLRMFINAM